MAGVVGGVECSDGDEGGVENAAVWLCATLLRTCVWCLRAVWQHRTSVGM